MRAKGLSATQAKTTSIKPSDLLTHIIAENRKWVEVSKEHLLRKGNTTIDEINKYIEVLRQDTEVLKQMLSEDESYEKTVSENDESSTGQDKDRKPQVPTHALKKSPLRDNESSVKFEIEEQKSESPLKMNAEKLEPSTVQPVPPHKESVEEQIATDTSGRKGVLGKRPHA